MKQSFQEKIASYKTHQSRWEKYASIRTRPRRILEEEENVYYFPLERQPICIHPMVEKTGEGRRHYILIQSLFKYLNDIANIEKDIINRVAYNITKDAYGIKFSRDIKQDALSIIIDESYHAYVALDFIDQIERKTQTTSLPLPIDTELSLAIKYIKGILPSDCLDPFDLISVCIAEHALTNDLIVVSKSKEISKTFYNVMYDHVLDEGRHATFFAFVLEVYWESLSESHKKIIGPLLPELIRRYVSPDLQRQFDSLILEQIGFNQLEIQKIVEESWPDVELHKLKDSHIIVKQMVALLTKTKVMEHPETKEAFFKYGIK